jgi:hypothetical protein
VILPFGASFDSHHKRQEVYIGQYENLGVYFGHYELWEVYFGRFPFIIHEAGRGRGGVDLYFRLVSRYDNKTLLSSHKLSVCSDGEVRISKQGNAYQGVLGNSTLPPSKLRNEVLTAARKTDNGNVAERVCLSQVCTNKLYMPLAIDL